MAIQVEWFDGLSKDVDKENFEKSLLSSKIILDRLKEICYNRQDKLNRARLKDYDSPNWCMKRAHQDGKVDALDDIISLITLDPRESK
jgi:hypothetical protein